MSLFATRQVIPDDEIQAELQAILDSIETEDTKPALGLLVGEVTPELAEERRQAAEGAAWRRDALIASLESAEARYAKRKSGKQTHIKDYPTVADAIIDLLYSRRGTKYESLMANQIAKHLSGSNTQSVFRVCKELAEKGVLKVIYKQGKKQMELFALAGIPYANQLHSLRSLAAHPHNAFMHGEPLHWRTIEKRLEAGLTPTLALLRPRQERHKWAS